MKQETEDEGPRYVMDALTQGCYPEPMFEVAFNESFLAHLHLERGLSPHTCAAYRGDGTRFLQALPPELLRQPAAITERHLLDFLVEERKPPQQILERLSAMVRSSEEKRYFVTSTIAVINFRTGRLEITNAGHPPTYLLRDGEVEEILLPGPPLGTLDGNYGYHEVDLVSGDVVVWLSDGLIEATTAAGDPFGYDRLASALEGPTASPEEARDRLLDAVEEYTGGHPADDDRTLVAMGFTRSPRSAD